MFRLKCKKIEECKDERHRVSVRLWMEKILKADLEKVSAQVQFVWVSR